MTKDPNISRSQDSDRKRHNDHIKNNPRSVKDIPTAEDKENTQSEARATIIAKGHTITTNPTEHKFDFVADDRTTIHHENTNHFTSRSDGNK